MSTVNSSSPSTQQVPDLATDAELAAKGDHDAFDRLFAHVGGSAWGVAFVATEAVSTATDAVADGFTEILHTFDSGVRIDNVNLELARATRAAAVRAMASEDAAQHAREPASLLGETRDRQSTLALTALGEPDRSALWLVDVEGFTLEQTSTVVNRSFQECEEMVRHARSAFRTHYVDAVKRDGLDHNCTRTLDRLAAYLDHAVPAGDVIEVESHLATCDQCRGIVAKLSDLETRLRAGIPAVPAWTRQSVADTWTAMAPQRAAAAKAAAAPAIVESAQGNDVNERVGLHTPLIWVAAAVLVVLGSIGVATVLSESKDATSDAGETASAQLAAPPRSATLTANAVVTPDLQPADTPAIVDGTTTTVPGTPVPATVPATTVPPTTAAPTTTQAPRAPVTTLAPRQTTPPTTVRTEPPTTTSTTQPTLIDLP